MSNPIRLRSLDGHEACRILMDLDERDPFRFGEAVVFYRIAPGPEGLRLIRGDEIVALANPWFLVGGRRLRYRGIERIELGGHMLFESPSADRWGFAYLKAFVPPGHGIAADSYMNAP